jgi:hypothetical protein
MILQYLPIYILQRDGASVSFALLQIYKEEISTVLLRWQKLFSFSWLLIYAQLSYLSGETPIRITKGEAQRPLPRPPPVAAVRRAYPAPPAR